MFAGVIFDVYQWDQLLFDGSTRRFEKLRRPDTVLVIPVTSDGKVVFAVEQQPGSEVVVQFPGGRVEENEDPFSAAKRELLEETGLEAEELVLIDEVQPVTKIEWRVYTFVARRCHQVTEQQLDPGERIQLEYMSVDEAIARMAAEDFPDAKGKLAHLAVQAEFSALKRQELRNLLVGS